MADWSDIESKAAEFRKALDGLENVCGETDRQMRRVLDRRRGKIEEASARVAAARAELEGLVTDSKSLFKSRKTQVVSGIKVGFQGKGGGWVVADEQAAIEEARKLLGSDQLKHVVKTTESLIKNGLKGLSDEERRRLGVTYRSGTDTVVANPTSGEALEMAKRLTQQFADDEGGEAEASQEAA